MADGHHTYDMSFEQIPAGDDKYARRAGKAHGSQEPT